MLLVLFPDALEPYFCLGKNQKSKFAKFILKLILRKNIFRVLSDNFSIIGSPIVKFMRFHRIISKSSVFYRISSISMNLSPKTRKNIFQKVSFKIKFANFDLWFFPNEKYGSNAPAKNTKRVVIE